MEFGKGAIMKFGKFVELVEATGYSMRSYSGRGMNGKQCVAIDTDHTAMTVALDLISEYLGECNRGTGSIGKAQDLCELLKNASSDSMGRGYIIYFPEIEWVVR